MTVFCCTLRLPRLPCDAGVCPVPPDWCADRLPCGCGGMDIVRGLLYIPIEPQLKERSGQPVFPCPAATLQPTFHIEFLIGWRSAVFSSVQQRSWKYSGKVVLAELRRDLPICIMHGVQLLFAKTAL
jgi:hypothetical protein